jgi:phosphoglycolate phosphatase
VEARRLARPERSEIREMDEFSKGPSRDGRGRPSLHSDMERTEPAGISISRSRLLEADAYIFDIDGTLLATQDLVHWNALHQAMLETYGVDTTIEGIQYHGKTDVSILRAALDREGIRGSEFERKLPRALEIVCREVEANHGGIKVQVCTGVNQLLDHLRNQRKLIGVASGNLATVGWHKIAAAGLRSFFSFGFFSDSCETRPGIFRSALEFVQQQLGGQARALFIGDTPSDIQAAREVNAAILAVSTGTFSFDDLKACSPDLCVSHCGELFQSQ